MHKGSTCQQEVWSVNEMDNAMLMADTTYKKIQTVLLTIMRILLLSMKSKI